MKRGTVFALQVAVALAVLAVSFAARAADWRGISVVVPDTVRVAEGFDPADSAGLFVGVRQFEEEVGKAAAGISEIPYAVDDAVDLAHLFALELKLVPATKVTLAIAGVPQKAESRERLKELQAAGAAVTDARFTTLLRLVTRAKNQAEVRGLLVLSFATHGFSQNGDRLLGQDSSLADVELTGLPVARLLDDVTTSRAPRRLVLLDACRERLTPGRSLGEPVAAMSATFAKAVAAAKGTAVLAGTVAGGFSYDDPALGNGVFTASVLRGLKGEAGSDERGFVTPSTLAAYVDGQVKRWVEVNRPAHKDQSAGIGFQVDDQLLSLTINPRLIPT